MEENEQENILPNSEEEDEAKQARKAIANRRIFWLFVLLSLVMVGLIVWEIIDIVI